MTGPVHQGADASHRHRDEAELVSDAPPTSNPTASWLASSSGTLSRRDVNREEDVMRLMGRADLLHHYLLQASALSSGAERHDSGQKQILAEITAGFIATKDATSLAATTKGRGDAYQRWGRTRNHSSIVPEVFEPSIGDAAEALELPASAGSPASGPSRTTSGNHRGLTPVKYIWAEVLTILILSIALFLVFFSS